MVISCKSFVIWSWLSGYQFHIIVWHVKFVYLFDVIPRKFLLSCVGKNYLKLPIFFRDRRRGILLVPSLLKRLSQSSLVVNRNQYMQLFFLMANISKTRHKLSIIYIHVLAFIYDDLYYNVLWVMSIVHTSKSGNKNLPRMIITVLSSPRILNM